MCKIAVASVAAWPSRGSRGLQEPLQPLSIDVSLNNCFILVMPSTMFLFQLLQKSYSPISTFIQIQNFFRRDGFNFSWLLSMLLVASCLVEACWRDFSPLLAFSPAVKC